MIELYFDNWHLTQRSNTPPAYQYDNDTIPVIVTGNIPDGWDWNLLLGHGEYLDVAHMDETDDGLIVMLTAEQLAFDGYYTAQLRASQGDKVKHSSPVLFSVGDSLSGDEQWPEIPTAFTQAVERAEAAAEAAEGVEQTVTQARDDAVSAAQDAADSKTAAAGSATDAAGSAEDAEDAAQSAEAAVERYPRIGAVTGNWERWQDGEWVDTGVHAEGPQGEPGEVSEAELNTGLATKADKISLAYTDKRLNYLYELTQGQAWDTEAGATPAYSQPVPAGAKAAEVGSIGGKTVVWNQLATSVTAENYATQRDVTDVSFSDGVCTFTATAKSGIVFSLGTDLLLDGHVYYRRSMAKANAGTPLTVIADAGISSVAITASGGWDVAEKIFTPSETIKPSTDYGVRDNSESGWTPISFKDVRRFDLTQHFGAGSEPTNTSDPRIAAIISYAEEHPEYDAGSLMSAKVTEVESEGSNFWGGIKMAQQIKDSVPNSVLDTDAKTITYIASDINGVKLVSLDPTKTYTLFIYGSGTPNLGSDGVFTSTGSRYPTINRANVLRNATYIKGVWVTGKAVLYYEQCGLFEGELTEDDFSPYKADTLEIPAALRTYLSDKGYGWSAGTAYNEIDWARKVYVQRVGSVDLGTLTWSLASGAASPSGYIFRHEIQCGVRERFTLSNVICPIYSTTSDLWYTSDPENMQMFVRCDAEGETGVLYVRNDTYDNDAAAFKSAMSGVILYYELSTPIEYDISAYLPADNLLTVEAGGTLTFVQEGGTELQIPNSVDYLINLSEAI